MGHFPLVCGVIGVAVAVEEIMVHPDEPAPQEVLVALAAGVGLFLGSTVLAHRRLNGEVLWTRLGVIAATGAAVLASPAWLPVWPLVTATAGLVVLVALERRRAPEHSPEPDGTLA